MSTFLGAGFLKPGPGTWASVAAVLLWLLFAALASPTPPALRAVTLLAALVAIVAGIPAATVVEFESDREDPGHVVIDEVAGQCGLRCSPFAATGTRTGSMLFWRCCSSGSSTS